MDSETAGFRIRPLLPTWHPMETGAPSPRFRRLRRVLRLLRYIRAYAVVRRIVRRERPAIVQWANWRFAIDGPLVWWVGTAGNPVMVDLAHSPRPLNEQRQTGEIFRPRARLHALQEQAYRRMDAVMVLGERSREDFAHTWPSARRIEVIPHGDESIFRSDRPVKNPSECGQEVLFFGNLATYKGLPILLDAFRLLRQSLPEASLTIAGAPTNDTDVAALNQRAIAIGRIDLRVGYVPLPDVSDLFGNARVVVAPYVYANASGVVSLAQTFARPVVASDVGDLRDAVVDGSTGLLVPPEDPAALAEALRRLLVEPDLADAWGRAGYERLQEHSCVAHRGCRGRARLPHRIGRPVMSRSGAVARPASVVYLVSRFPKVTETFIVDEITELNRLGMDIDIFSLIRQREDAVQPAAEKLLPAVRFGSRSPVRLLGSQWRWLRRRPGTLLRLWLAVLAGNRCSASELFKSITTMFVAVDWADQLLGREPRRIHAHWATHPALAAYVMAGLLDIKYSFTAHAHDIFGPNAMLERKLAAADFVVTISDFNLRLLRERYGPAADRVRVLHCGIDLEKFPPATTRTTPISGPVRLLCVASLTDYKGHRHLLDALALLNNRGVDAACTLVGDGPLRRDLELHARDLGVADRTRFLGRRPSPEVRAQLSSSDVFVLPSVQASSGFMEGIPVALMEAMAAGCPVIASDLSGIPELVEDGVTGILVPPGNAEALAEAIERLSRDPKLRARMTAAGREKVAASFDLHKNVAELHRWLPA